MGVKIRFRCTSITEQLHGADIYWRLTFDANAPNGEGRPGYGGNTALTIDVFDSAIAQMFNVGSSYDAALAPSPAD